ncbi:hypothetical protein DXP70_07945 [Listeria monocytogenes]|nr:hypothetical protein [Listeria monocytogenes]MDB02991.1 hypothetical protein [Listeria monocytogenes]MDB35335.1 hypothetical protein [Listeria monocytogenes]
MGKSKKVKNTISTIPAVVNDIVTSFNGVRIDFKDNHRWLKSDKQDKFTNYLQSNNDFGKMVYTILNKIIPMIQTEWTEIKSNRFKHCHPIDAKHKEVFHEYFKIMYPKYDLDELNVWQFGVSGGARLIASITNEENGISIVRPLFVDYHHLIYPSEKHNQNDVFKYKFCPYNEYD